MVHDPRVSSCLSRLGGVYSDPARVDRDASTLLRSSVGANLVPIVAETCESSRRSGGNKSFVLVLQGTIAIYYRKQTYQILMDQYLPAGYPNRPPIPFVRLAPNMYLKENHKHVGSDGKVYLPYLHDWKPNTHNLVELVVNMSSVFSAEPPVFTRREGACPPQKAPRANTSFAQPTMDSTVDPIAAAAGGTLSDEDAIKAVEAQKALENEQRRRMEEDRRKMEEQRRLEKEREEKRRKEENERWESQRTEQARAKVTAKLRQHIQGHARQTQQQITGELDEDMRKLKVAREQKIEASMTALTKHKTLLEEQLDVAEKAKMNAARWIEQVKRSKEQKQVNGEISIDEKVFPESRLHGQMMELSAENAAITDALFFLDKAMHKGYLSCEVHLKQVRELATRQFLVRAHLMKISQSLTMSY